MAWRSLGPLWATMARRRVLWRCLWGPMLSNRRLFGITLDPLGLPQAPLCRLLWEKFQATPTTKGWLEKKCACYNHLGASWGFFGPPWPAEVSCADVCGARCGHIGAILASLWAHLAGLRRLWVACFGIRWGIPGVHRARPGPKTQATPTTKGWLEKNAIAAA